MTERFDFVIVGAGSAGCVIANRLSANPDIRVALIEAGDSDQKLPLRLKTGLPIGNIFLLSDPRYNWQYEYTGGSSINGRHIPVPRGKMFGGCSSLNGAIYARGHPDDYDRWAELGNTGWRHQDVLPHFLQQENWLGADADPAVHARGGDLDVHVPGSPHLLSRAFLEAAREAGHTLGDVNDGNQEGFEICQVNQRAGVRMSSSRAFLRPALKRPNLAVLANTLALRVVIADRRAVGVEVEQNGRRRIIGAGEVILAGGTINSPQLLMLSGVGPAADLHEQGIEPIHDLRGVGRNLHDHPAVAVAVENPSGESYALSLRSLPRIAISPLQYLLKRTGMLASNAVETRGNVTSLPGLDKPDLAMAFIVGMKNSASVVPRQHGCVALAALHRPKSRGHLALSSADARTKPVLHYDMLADPEDLAGLVRAVREIRKILGAPALKPYLGREIVPGEGVESDADLEAAVRATAATAYHPVGTCKMGPASDRLAVVDPQLRVHGISGLRVADASIMPEIIGGNTSAPAMMIGQRGAAFALGNRSGYAG